VRFQDAARDARAVVYAGIQADPLVARLATLAADASYGQRLLARAVMNGESTEPETWRRIFPSVLGAGAPDPERAEAILAASLEVAGSRSEVSSGGRSWSHSRRCWWPGERGQPQFAASVACCSTASPPRFTRTT
jgi:hypothetical protein